MGDASDQATCFECRGRGTLAVFWDAAEDGGFDPARRCHVCGGSGVVPAQQLEWRREGRKHYQARVAARESVLSCARRLGLSSAQVSGMEHGRADPAPLTQDTAALEAATVVEARDG